jgi:PadR family transcriptional regulator, regulatory protein PadR
LYPVLRSLERLGLLTSEMEPSTTGPPRRYYKPTALGKSQFAEWTEVWNRTRNWLDGVLEQKDEQRDNKRTQHSTRRS